LAQLFAVKLYGYAVMSNHHHVVLEIEPEAVSRWSEEEIADRWLNTLNRPYERHLHSNPKNPSVMPHKLRSRKPMPRMPNAGSANAPTPGRWQRANGFPTALKEYAKEIGLCWIRTYPARTL
jgi:hypothetical protein